MEEELRTKPEHDEEQEQQRQEECQPCPRAGLVGAGRDGAAADSTCLDDPQEVSR